MWKLKDINQYLLEARVFTAKELQKKAQELLKGLGITVHSKKLLDDTINHIIPKYLEKLEIIEKNI